MAGQRDARADHDVFCDFSSLIAQFKIGEEQGEKLHD